MTDRYTRIFARAAATEGYGVTAEKPPEVMGSPALRGAWELGCYAARDGDIDREPETIVFMGGRKEPRFFVGGRIYRVAFEWPGVRIMCEGSPQPA